MSIKGILSAPDLHIDAVGPSSRVDDYFETGMAKLNMAKDIANEHDLIAVFAGDFFNRPYISTGGDYVKSRVISALWDFKHRPIIMPGNHDMSGNELAQGDSLWLIGVSRAARVKVASAAFDIITMEDADGKTVRVGIGGTPYGKEVPTQNPWNEDIDFGVWFTHDNFQFQSHYKDEKSYGFHHIPGVNIVINGHLHHPCPDVVIEDDAHESWTTWMNPGSIMRTKVNEKDRIPAFGIVYPPSNNNSGSYLDMPIQLDGYATVFSSGAGRAAMPKVEISSTLGDTSDEHRNRFIEFLVEGGNSEDNVGALLDAAHDRGAIDSSMRRWLEGIVAEAGV